MQENNYKYLIVTEGKQKYLWELLLELANWQCYLKDYYHYEDIKNKKHREDHISDIIDKLSLIRVLVEDIKKHIIVNSRIIVFYKLFILTNSCVLK